MLQALDAYNRWYAGKVEVLEPVRSRKKAAEAAARSKGALKEGADGWDRLFVHFMGWPREWDEWYLGKHACGGGNRSPKIRPV